MEIRESHSCTISEPEFRKCILKQNIYANTLGLVLNYKGPILKQTETKGKKNKSLFPNMVEMMESLWVLCQLPLELGKPWRLETKEDHGAACLHHLRCLHICFLGQCSE